jgi:Zn-dependent protease
MSGFDNIVVTILLIAVPMVVAITFHEAAHGWAAWKLGDDTAKRLGRVTFNPIRHVDPFGTVMLPGLLALGQFAVGTWPPFLIGWAKPVPVDFMALRDPRWGMVLVALAGPAINLLLAFASALLTHLFVDVEGAAGVWIGDFLFYSVWINLLLMAFNLIPIPPLDGGRVMVGVLPRPLAWRYARLERVGMFALIGVVVILPLIGSQLGQDWSILADILLPVVNALARLVYMAAGVA